MDIQNHRLARCLVSKTPLPKHDTWRIWVALLDHSFAECAKRQNYVKLGHSRATQMRHVSSFSLYHLFAELLCSALGKVFCSCLVSARGKEHSKINIAGRHAA